jgi:hypothetical protein
MPLGAGLGGADRGVAGRYSDAIDFTADLTERVTVDLSWRPGMGFGNGLIANQGRVLVNGFEQILLHHPGLPALAPTLGSYAREATAEARYQRFSDDAADPAAPGGLVSLTSATGGPLRVWGSFASGAILGRTLDNPADSSASSLEAGARVGSTLANGRGSWMARAGYSTVADPTAAPFADGAESPVVRRRELLSAESRVILHPSPRASIELQAAGATGSETSPLLPGLLGSAGGSELSASDLFLGAAMLLRGEEWRSTTRLSFGTTKREWTTASADEVVNPLDRTVTGGVAVLPGEFSERLLALGQVLEMPWAAHLVAIGGTVGLRRSTHDWLPYSHPRLVVDEASASGHGLWASRSGAAPELSVPELGVFMQDTWRPNAHWRVRVGVRFESQFLPDDLAAAHGDFRAAFGVIDTLVPSDHRSGLGARLAIGWDPAGRGNTLLELAGGLQGGRYDAAAVAEVARSADPITVTRTMGDLAAPATSVEGQALSLFGPGVRAPRQLSLAAGLVQVVGPGTVLSLRGGFHHTDFLLRRDNINLPAGPLAFDGDGRAIWGTLDHRGAILAAVPGSNVRVTGFDQVWGLVSTGYSEQRFVSAAFMHSRPGGITLRAEYTWSRTEDNRAGLLSADPADRALVVDPMAAEDWSDGRSDLDVPHQLALSARLGGGPGDRHVVAARWRWRSGLPFTPGFAPGVDVNADGSSANDPVGLESVAGIRGHLTDAGCTVGSTGVAERNSCRGPALHGLDVELGYQVWHTASGRLDITLEGFNLIAGGTGIVDRAAVLVDPTGSITTSPAGTLVLPLVLNAHFGELQSRRTAPRTIRLGLRFGN